MRDPLRPFGLRTTSVGTLPSHTELLAYTYLIHKTGVALRFFAQHNGACPPSSLTGCLVVLEWSCAGFTSCLYLHSIVVQKKSLWDQVDRDKVEGRGSRSIHSRLGRDKVTEKDRERERDLELLGKKYLSNVLRSTLCQEMLVAYTKIENDASNKTAGLGWMSLATNPSLVRRYGIDLILFLQSKARCYLVHSWVGAKASSKVTF